MVGCQLTGYASSANETASRPFCVRTTFIATRWASCRACRPARWTMETWTNTSFSPSSQATNPKPLSALNHLTVPSTSTALAVSIRARPDDALDEDRVTGGAVSVQWGASPSAIAETIRPGRITVRSQHHPQSIRGEGHMGRGRDRGPRRRGFDGGLGTPRPLRAKTGRSCHSREVHASAQLQAARLSMPPSSGSMRKKASVSLPWQTARGTRFCTLVCCKRPGASASIREPSTTTLTKRFVMSEVDYVNDIRKYAQNVDANAVAGIIVKYLGIALKSRDSSVVACSTRVNAIGCAIIF